MTKIEKASYINKPAIATYHLSNFGGIEILDILHGIDDYVVARYYGNSIHCVKIRYGVNHSSFRIGRITIRLEDCLRI